MKHTGKRIIATMLVVVMLIGIAPMETMTGLDFGGMFGMKVDAAKPTVIIKDFSENYCVQTKSGYDTYNALRTGDIHAKFMDFDGSGKKWWYEFTTDKIVVRVLATAFSQPEKTENSYTQLNKVLQNPLDLKSADNNMRYMYKQFVPCNKSEYNSYDNTNGAVYLSWLDFEVDYSNGNVTLSCHKNTHVEFVFYNHVVAKNGSFFGFLKSKKRYSVAYDYDCAYYTSGKKAGQERKEYYSDWSGSMGYMQKPQTEQQYEICLQRNTGRSNYGTQERITPKFSFYVNNTKDDNIHITKTDICGKGVRSAKWQEMVSSGKIVYQFLCAPFSSGFGKINLETIAKSGFNLLPDTFSNFEEALTNIATGSVKDTYTGSHIESHANKKPPKFCFGAEASAPMGFRDKNDFFKVTFRLNDSFQTGNVLFYVKFSTKEDESQTITTKARIFNAAAVKDVYSTVYQAETSKLSFFGLTTTDNTNVINRNVAVVLNGAINNSGKQKIMSYGFLVKKGSSALTMNDAKWTCNNATNNGTVSLSQTIKDLEPNTQYFYAVFAKTSQGLFCSSVKSFRTKKIRPYETKIQSVKTVNYRNGELLNSNELGTGDSVSVEWAKATYAEWYKMEITYPDGTTEIKDQLKGTKATVQLTEAGEYKFKVCACNTAGESDWTTTEDKAIVHSDVSLSFVTGNDAIGYRTYETHTLTWGHDLESMPAIPSRVGAAFCGWFRAGESTLASVKNIREDTVLYAGYKETVFTVRFQDANGKDIGDPQKIPYGGTATPPEVDKVPIAAGYEFIGWDHSYVNIVENLSIRAVINKQDGELPVTIVNDGSPTGTVTAERYPYGYVIKCTVRNETLNDARGRVIVAVKSDEGKLLRITESEAYFIEGNDRGVISDNPNADKSAYNSEQIKIVIPIDLEDDANGLDAKTAEVYAVESFQKTVPVSNAVIATVVDCDPWSKWTLEDRTVENEGDKQERTEYRYQVLQTTQTNFLKEKNALVEQGWSYQGTNANDPKIVTSGWSKTKPQDLEYRKIEEKTVDDTTPTKYYLYKRYKYYNGSDWMLTYGSTWATNKGYSGSWQYKKTTSELPKYKPYEEKQSYGKKGDFWFAGGSNTGQGKSYEGIDYTKNTAMINVKTGSHKEYRSVDTIYTYNLNKWSDWSEWSSDIPVLDIDAEKIITKPVDIPLTDDEKEGKEVAIQTRKFYRYKDNKIVVTPTVDPDPAYLNEEFCTGNLGVGNAGKQLTLFVYKYNEVSDWTTEYVAQSTVENDGSYTFEQGILRERPTTETGDFTVILSVQGSTDSIYLGKIEAPKPTYKVIFMRPPIDGESDSYVPIPVRINGTLSDTQLVEEGDNALVPEAPEIEGMTFLHWDMRSTDIRSDTVINAVYARNEYTVIFHDPENAEKPITYQRIPHGTTLRVDQRIGVEAGTEESNEAVVYCPFVAESTEMEFVQWDLIDPMIEIDSETNENVISREEITVTSDLVLTALYKPRTYEVVFMDIDEQETESALQSARSVVKVAQEETEVGEMHAVKVQKVQYGETLTTTDGFVDDIDFGDEVVLLGWTAEGDDTLVDFDTYTITEDTYLIPQYTFLNTAERPVADVESGSYTAVQTVTLTSETENALIYYTLDGSDPSDEENTAVMEYTQPIAITSSCTLRARAYKFNCNNSDEATYVYAINDGSAPTQHVVTYATYDLELPLVQFLANEGEKLDASVLPEAEGFTFDNAYRSVQAPTEEEDYPTFSEPWSYETDTVIEDVTLYLNYTANTYTVTFLDYDGFVLDEQEITYSSSAEEPDAPERDGYVFVGWDTQAYEYVTGELEVTAMYVPESEYARVTLNRTKYTATAGTSLHLTAEVTGEIENPELIWSSSDENVAIVDDEGNVTTTGKGTADITVQIENSIEYAVCKLTVLPDPNAELMLRSNSYLTMDDYGFIRGFTVHTDSDLNHTAPTVAEVKSEFANSDLEFVTLSGKTLADDDYVGTGTVIRLMDGETVLDNVQVIVSGDLNGDGVISTRDASMIMQTVVGKLTLTDLQISAADVNGDGSVNNRDASMISRYLVGKETL